MSKRIKKMEVAILAQKFEGVDNCVIVGYKGMTVEGAVALRRELRQQDVQLTVFKNSLATRAFRQAKLDRLEPFLDGETAIAIGPDPITAPRLLETWRKKNKGLELRGGLVEGTVVDAAGIKAVAEIPSKEELLSRILGSMQSPATGLVSVLSALTRNLAYGLKALAEKKEAESA